MLLDAQLRPFGEAADLETVVRFYNDVFAPLRPYYSWPITVQRFQDKVLRCWEYRREGFWLAFHHDQLVGFILACLRGQQVTENDDPGEAAHVSVIAVDPRCRRQGIGRALYEKAEAFARASGARMITATCNPMSPMAFFIAPQENWKDAQRFFGAMGFDLTDVGQNLLQSIVGFELGDAAKQKIRRLEAEGYECRLYEQRDHAALLRLLETNEWPFWHMDLLSKTGNWTKTRPFIETCFMDCATDEICGPDEIGVVIRRDQMLSFCVQTISREKRVAYTGPVLTHPGARNRGLGYVAVQLSLKRAAEKGAIMCDVWTGSDAHRTRFYTKCGFRPIMRWPRFEKKLV